MITDGNAKQVFIASYPAFADMSPRTQQGALAIAKVLSSYGQPTPGDPTVQGQPLNGIDHNWAGLTAPADPGGACLPGTYKIPNAGFGLNKGCIILFDTDAAGIAEMITAINNDALVSQALVQGDILALASALGGSQQFGPQAVSVSGSSVNTLGAMLGTSIINIATATGQTPDWYVGKERVDQMTTNTQPTPQNQNTATNTTTPPADASTGPSTGALVAGFGVAALIGYGLYKMSKAGPR